MEFPPSYFEALKAAEGLEPSAKNIERISMRLGVTATQWAFSQLELRQKARSKFSRADSMLFVREALEQASHERIAEYHASLFPAGVRIMDMTAGIGGDLIALAARCVAIGYEQDPERASCLRWNLSALGLKSEVSEKDSMTAMGSFDYVYVDPARRVGGRRTLRIDEFAPDPAQIASAMAKKRLGIIKLSPLLPDETLESLGCKLEFISWQGECREALVHCGSEAGVGRWAVHLNSGLRLEAGNAPPIAAKPDEYVFEADPAAIRAHALGSLAEAHKLEALGSSPGYLTGSSLIETPWLTAYRTVAVLPLDIKKIAEELKTRNARAEAVKVRGVDVRPEDLLPKLPRKGEHNVYVAIYRDRDKPRALLLSKLT